MRIHKFLLASKMYNATVDSSQRVLHSGACVADNQNSMHQDCIPRKLLFTCSWSCERMMVLVTSHQVWLPLALHRLVHLPYMF